MNFRRLIARAPFQLMDPLPPTWNIPGIVKHPGADKMLARYVVPQGAIWEVGNTAEERQLIAQIRGVVADGDDPDIVSLIQGFSQAEETIEKAFRESEDVNHRLYEIQKETDANLQKTTADLEKAQEVASLSLEEVAQNFMRLDLPKVSPKTRAQIKEAVMMYTTDTGASLRSVAAKFKVSHQRVSQWFQTFTSATGIAVIRHRRHESVRTRTERDQREQLPAKKTPPR
jgi:hypothetical protein